MGLQAQQVFTLFWDDGGSNKLICIIKSAHPPYANLLQDDFKFQGEMGAEVYL